MARHGYNASAGSSSDLASVGSSMDLPEILELLMLPTPAGCALCPAGTVAADTDALGRKWTEDERATQAAIAEATKSAIAAAERAEAEGYPGSNGEVPEWRRAEIRARVATEKEQKAVSELLSEQNAVAEGRRGSGEGHPRLRRVYSISGKLPQRKPSHTSETIAAGRSAAALPSPSRLPAPGQIPVLRDEPEPSRAKDRQRNSASMRRHSALGISRRRSVLGLMLRREGSLEQQGAVSNPPLALPSPPPPGPASYKV